MEKTYLKNSFAKEKEKTSMRHGNANGAKKNKYTSKNRILDKWYPLRNTSFLFASLVLVEVTHADWLADCGNCLCKWNSGKKTADCRNLSLFLIPNSLSSELQVLDLSHNEISHLESNAFLNSHLQNLHKLYIRNASIEKLDSLAFNDLKILIELDISNNLLRVLRINQFHHLVKVRVILINNNLLEILPDGVFQSLSYLNRVELRGNRLKHVGTKAFQNLPILSQIYLDENRLHFLRKECFESLKRLTALSLDNNPWNCTCELQNFRYFVLERNLYTPPTSCYYPAHLRGTLWNEDHMEAFVCKPKILYPTEGATFHAADENATLVCKVKSSMNTQIIWKHSRRNGRGGVNHPVFNGSRVQIYPTYVETSNQKILGYHTLISRLNIFGADKNDEGSYACVAENFGGKDTVQMNLMVTSNTPKDMLLLNKYSIVVISMAALGLLSLCFLLTLTVYCLYRRLRFQKDMAYTHKHVIVESTGAVMEQTRGADDGCGKSTKTTDFQIVYNENAQNKRDKTMKLSEKVLYENGKCLLSYANKDESMQSPRTNDKINVIVYENSSVLQKQKGTAGFSNISFKGNNDFPSQQQHSFSVKDFQPDLLLTYNQDKAS